MTKAVHLNKHSIAVLKNAVCPILGVDSEVALHTVPWSSTTKVGNDLNVFGPDFVLLWETIIKLAGPQYDPFFLGRAMASGPVIPIFLAFSSAPNLKEGVHRLARYKALFGPVALNLSLRNGGLRLKITADHSDIDLPASLAIPIAIFIVEKARNHTARHIIPTRVTLPKGDVDLIAAQTYFGQEVSQSSHVVIEFSSRDVRTPFLSENEALWREIENDLEQKLTTRDQGVEFQHQVEAVIRRALNVGPVRAEAVCEELGLSRSTMQRKLRENSYSYQTILDRVRQELAIRYLEKSTLMPFEIARLIGFGDPKSFHRAFKKWTGLTPEKFRAEI